MQRYKMLVFLCLYCVTAGVFWANPFTGTSNSPAPVHTEQPPEFLVERQAQLHTQLGEALYEWTKTHSLQTFWTIIGFAFFYGFMHALGPGHRKTVVFSFYLSKAAPVWEPALTGFILAGLHGVTSIALLFIFRNVAGALSAHTASAAAYLEGASYLLLMLLSVFSLLHALSHSFPKRFRFFHFGCGCGGAGEDERCGADETGNLHNGSAQNFRYGRPHQHEGRCVHHNGDCCCEDRSAEAGISVVQRVQWGGLLLSGIYPCPAALLVLVLVSNLEAAGVGILAVASMSAGMAVPIILIAYLAWAGRTGLFKRLQKTETYLQTASLVLGLAAYTGIFIFSLVCVLPFLKSVI